MKITDLNTKCFPTWCPGCGNIAIWAAFREATAKEGWNSSNSALIAGIGCHGHMTNFTKLTSFEGLHGRALPVAEGLKLVKPNLNVFVFTGDGDCFGEGGNHFIHACRRNCNLTVILHNNGLYALTTGQTSPLSPKGFKSKSTPFGNPDIPVNPEALAIISGATFVARAYAGDISKLTELIIQANNHVGFSFIDVLQPCVTFNNELTHQFFQKNTYQLADFDRSDKATALSKACESKENKIPLGIFYCQES